jgi:translation initiation factor 1
MSAICSVCGLPEELCMCKAIAQEEQRIRIKLEKRKWGRDVTVIEGINDRDIDIHDLASTLKSKCACGGTAKNGVIELQGDHRGKARKILISLGFKEDNIVVE